jgi:ribosomal protein L40E
MAKRICLRCGSDKIIPNIPLIDIYGDLGRYSTQMRLSVHGNPSAWFFKDSESGLLTGFICGACGYTELKTEGFQKLYEKYVESLQKDAPPSEERRDQPPPAEEPSDPIVCLSCGASIPPDSNNCSACGWTWVVEDEQV